MKKQAEIHKRFARSSWIVAVILMLLLRSTTSYAAPSNQELLDDPGLISVNEAHLVAILNQQQTIDGMTVKLEYAYADVNRIAFRITSEIDAPNGEQYQFGETTVSDDMDHTFGKLASGWGGVPVNDTTVKIFNEDSLDASVITEMPDQLNLRLETSIQRGIQVTTHGGGGGSGGRGDSASASDTGPFIFKFTIPFNHGYVVEPDQPALMVNGITVTLKQLIIAPSLTRLVICFDPTSSKGDAPHFSLRVGGKAVDLGDSVQQVFAVTRDGNAEGCYNLRIAQPLYSYRGLWQLSVDSITSSIPVGYAQDSSDSSITWRFKGSPDVLALMRTRLELALKPYNIQLVRTGDNLQFSFAGASGIDQDTITNLVVKAAETEIAGPWMFTFDVPPAL